jgi:hypothetical protein
MWSYQPLLSGLIPAVVLILYGHIGRGLRWPVLAGSFVVVIAGAAQLFRWRWRFDYLATATGEYSTPVRTSILMCTVAAILLAITAQRGLSRAALRATASSAGFLASATAIGLLAASAGFPPQENYYVAKMLQAVWLSASPIIVGLTAWALAQARGRVPHPAGDVLALSSAVLAGLTLAAVPDGRYLGKLGGPELLARRVMERDRAAHQVQVIGAASAAGPASDDAAVLVEPQGWFYNVAFDGPDADEWVRDGISASEWLNALRGVYSERQATAVRCLGRKADETAIPCLAEWLSSNPHSKLVVLLSQGNANGAPFETLEDAFPFRVRVLSRNDRGDWGSSEAESQ